MSTPTVDLQHSLLGSIRGLKKSEDVHQFLGVKYATIPSRFADPIICSDKDIDATQYGPSAPSLGTCEGEQTLIQQPLPASDKVHEYSEFDCANLNISIPVSQGRPLSDLPVFVWIHGGGLILGSNSWPQYDLARFVELSVSLGKPIIGVGINYRLGALGFLASTEMRTAGFTGNSGLKDQVAALEWVHRYIKGFGGDPHNITVAGQSAGGASVTLLLQHDEPRFKRAIVMGGQCRAKPPASIEVHDQLYRQAVETLGLGGVSPGERLKALQTMDAQALLGKLGFAAPATPLIDGTFLRKDIDMPSIQDPNDLTLPGKNWCEALMLGDCQADGYILSFPLMGRKAGIGAAFAAHIKSQFADEPSFADELLTTYNLSSTTPDEDAFHSIVSIFTDVGFYVPTILTAKGWPTGKPSFVYHFNQRNPWPGPFQGLSNHIFDCALLFQNYQERLDGEAKQVGVDFATSFIAFIRGEKPWDTLDTGKVRVFGHGAGVQSLVDKDGDAGRSKRVWPLVIKMGYERLWTSVISFVE